MKTLHFGVVLLAVSAVWSTKQAHAEWKWQTLECPGTPCGISGNKIIARGYPGGYLYDGNTWTSLNCPGAGETDICGIDGNYIVGACWDSNLIYSGPVVFDGSTWKAVQCAGYRGVKGGYAAGISGKTIIGHYLASATSASFVTTVDAPWGYDGAVIIPNLPDPFFAGIDGINVIGTSGNRTFLLKMNPGGTSNWTWTFLDCPGYSYAPPSGISGNRIVGSLWGGNGFDHGFLYDGNTWQILDFPGAARTWANAISGDRIVGGYIDSNGQAHSFLLTVPEPATLSLLALGGLLLARRRRA